MDKPLFSGTPMGRFGKRGSNVSPVITDPSENDESKGATLDLTNGLWAEIDLIADMRSVKRGKKTSRADIGRQCMNWAIDQYWKEQGLARPANPLQALKDFRASKEWQNFVKQKKK